MTIRSKGDLAFYALAALSLGIAGSVVATSRDLIHVLLAVDFLAVGFTWAMWPMMRRNTFLSGYYRGQSAMMESVSEARVRGLSYAEWLTGEWERIQGESR